MQLGRLRAFTRSVSLVETTRSSLSPSSIESVPPPGEDTEILTRMKYLTLTKSEDMVSPIAQRLCDFEVGHSSVSVWLQTPLASREKESVSVPTMGLTTTFAVLDIGAGAANGGC